MCRVVPHKLENTGYMCFLVTVSLLGPFELAIFKKALAIWLCYLASSLHLQLLMFHGEVSNYFTKGARGGGEGVMRLGGHGACDLVVLVVYCHVSSGSKAEWL